MAVVQEFTEAARFKNRVCINHRDQHYTSGSTAFGSTDVMTPNFAISFPKEQFDPLTETRTHQKLEVSGTVTVVKGITGSKIHLIADSFTVVE